MQSFWKKDCFIIYLHKLCITMKKRHTKLVTLSALGVKLSHLGIRLLSKSQQLVTPLLCPDET